jgi:D-aminopeptidase
LGLGCGTLPPGRRNTIADVPGVLVGNLTIIEGDIRTGVTAVLPHSGELFLDKVLAAAVVLNGFGKSIGLMQIAELGTIETPILLTNTFAIGTCANALVRRAVRHVPQIGRQTSSVNPVVLECNDGYLNDIQAIAVTEAPAEAAIEAAAETFALGAVGAGTGMSCFGLKGGIGSASRRVRLNGADHHLGVLVLANFGRPGDLRLPDGRIGPDGPPQEENGSCIIVIGTDIPLDCRQLARTAKRAGVGLAWSGSFWGNDSGDVAVAFTTANRVPHAPDGGLLTHRTLAEGRIDHVFQAAADGHTRRGLAEVLAARPRPA